MGLRPGHQPLHPLLIGGGDFGGQVLPQPLDVIEGRTCFQRLDEHCGGALHHHAPDELLGRRRPRGAGHGLHPTAESVDHGGTPRRTGTGDQGRCGQAGTGHAGQQRDVGKLEVSFPGDHRQLVLDRGGRGRPVGVHRGLRYRIDGLQQRQLGLGPSGYGQHEVGVPNGKSRVDKPLDPVRCPPLCGVEGRHLGPGVGEIGSHQCAGLTKAEDTDSCLLDHDS